MLRTELRGMDLTTAEIFQLVSFPFRQLHKKADKNIFILDMKVNLP